MLSLSMLEQFIKLLKSGELEQKFFQASLQEKENMLELLEKTMDAGELADQVATHIIYRNLPMPEADKKMD